MLKDTPVMRDAQEAAASGDLTRLVVELEAYHGRIGRYPTSLQELVGWPIPKRAININDFSAGLLRQRPYQYHPARDGQTYRLFAVGPDGKPETSDDIYPSPSDTIPASPTTAPEE